MFLRGILADRPPFNKLLLVIGFALFSAVLFTTLGAVLSNMLYGVNVLGDPHALDNLSDPMVMSAMKLLQTLSAIGTFVLPPLVCAGLFHQDAGEWLMLNKMPGRLPSLLVIILIFIAVPFINWMMDWNAQMHLPASLKDVEDWMKASEDKAGVLTEMFLKSSTFAGMLLNLFIIALLPAIGEELIFRGTFQKLLQQMTRNAHAGIIISALVFSALHMQFYGFVPRFLLGVLFGYLFYWSGSLWLTILAHFINNGAAVVFTWCSAQGYLAIDQDTIGTKSGEEVWLIMSVAGTSVLTYLIYRFYRKWNTGISKYEKEQNPTL